MYDYVIVGAGSAGCVLAARLSEDADVSVLLVEAGSPDIAEEIRIPAALGHLIQTKWDWDYRTGPNRPGTGAPTTSTGLSRAVWVTTSSPSVPGCAAAPRWPTCIPPCSAPT